MEQATIAKKGSYKVDLKKDQVYLFCTCGKSSNQPFCDMNAHKGTGFKPQKFSVTEDGSYFLCGCKQSKNKPFCDATHKTL